MTEAADGNQEQMGMLAFTDADENRNAERHSGGVGRFEFCICGFEGIVIKLPQRALKITAPWSSG